MRRFMRGTFLLKGFSIGKKLGELYVWCSLDFANPSQMDKTFPIRIAPVCGMRRRRALQRVLWGALGKESVPKYFKYGLIVHPFTDPSLPQGFKTFSFGTLDFAAVPRWW
ncbi:hypothetical protein FA13DRAFT_1735355 [Coprinellus micaceus]|uniref:Uncharacterized protein n=1 Tax=Coprinellus micaceus TaxID=71717 RepID=A0A4Y7T3Y6_COPMI|nr:hypothetical protein FA13DRAFT_1735355 [Coprinellus micaceus]